MTNFSFDSKIKLRIFKRRLSNDGRKFLFFIFLSQNCSLILKRFLKEVLDGYFFFCLLLLAGLPFLAPYLASICAIIASNPCSRFSRFFWMAMAKSFSSFSSFSQSLCSLSKRFRRRSMLLLARPKSTGARGDRALSTTPRAAAALPTNSQSSHADRRTI